MAVSFPLFGGVLSGGNSQRSSGTGITQKVSTNIQNRAETRSIESSLNSDAVVSSVSSSSAAAATLENSAKISFLSQAEDALGEIKSSLERVEELATLAKNTSSADTQAALEGEKDQILQRVSELEQTQVDGKTLLSGSTANELGIPDVNVSSSLSSLDLTNQEDAARALDLVQSASSSTRNLGSAVSDSKSSVASDIEAAAIERQTSSGDVISQPEEAEAKAQEVAQQIKQVAKTDGTDAAIVHTLVEEELQQFLN